MLVEKNTVAAGEVVVLKPLEGPDIVGRLSKTYSAGDDTIHLAKVLTAHVVQDQGGIGLAFAPFSLAAKDDQVFKIPVSNLMVEPFPARDEVKKSYTGQTSSLVMP